MGSLANLKPWAKGTSGNPRGRPKKKKQPTPPTTATTEPTRALVLGKAWQVVQAAESPSSGLAAVIKALLDELPKPRPEYSQWFEPDGPGPSDPPGAPVAAVAPVAPVAPVTAPSPEASPSPSPWTDDLSELP